MNLKSMKRSFAAFFFIMIPLILSAERILPEPSLECKIDFRIKELKHGLVPCDNYHSVVRILGMRRRLTRITGEIVLIRASDEQKTKSPKTFKWLEANSPEIDFNHLYLDKEEEKLLIKKFKENKDAVFSNYSAIFGEKFGEGQGFVALLFGEKAVQRAKTEEFIRGLDESFKKLHQHPKSN